MPRYLPAPDAPLVAEDGTLVQPSVPRMFSRVQVPTNTEAQRLVTKTRRKLADLPALPKQLNSYSAVLVYTASGLSDTEIAVATGFTEEQINTLRQHEGYRTLEQMVLKAAREEAQSAVKSILVQGEQKAAERVVELVESEDEKIALAAAKDLLDRGGHRAKEEIDVRVDMMNTFRIEVVDRRNERVIDVEAE
jgi:predicted mannosyl-3-phosphoglycerate phosphatase (HAD superfamily)